MKRRSQSAGHERDRETAGQARACSVSLCASCAGCGVTLIVAIALGSFASALAIAYELALSRVPQHRAALEGLVRGQTGLDIRFNELTLRWGWYGPEAVLNRVELGEPGRSNVLLRAPQLIVAINAWQTMRAGRLVSGRITLIAADIDLERLTRRPPVAGQPAVPVRSILGSTETPRVRVLDRWKGGVIDLQGGTLRLPDPAGSGSALTLQIRRAAVRRAGQEWSGHALVFLPERLGRTARVVAQVTGDITSARHTERRHPLRRRATRVRELAQCAG